MKNYLKNGLAGILLAGALGLSSIDTRADDNRKINVSTNIVTRVKPEIYNNIETAADSSSREHTLNIEKTESPNYTPSRKANIEGIIIHSTEGSGDSALKWMTNPQSKASTHYLVIENGKTYQLVDDKDTAWQAGAKANPKYLGIEIAGYAHKPGFKFTDIQYENSAKLTASLIEKHKLSKDKVVSHDWISKNIGGTIHTDPGPNFDWSKFNQYLNKNLERNKR